MKQLLIVVALALALLPFAASSRLQEEVSLESLNDTVDAHLSARLQELKARVLP
jgi:hypothetical protein